MGLEKSRSENPVEDMGNGSSHQDMTVTFAPMDVDVSTIQTEGRFAIHQPAAHRVDDNRAG